MDWTAYSQSQQTAENKGQYQARTAGFAGVLTGFHWYMANKAWLGVQMKSASVTEICCYRYTSKGCLLRAQFLKTTCCFDKVLRAWEGGHKNRVNLFFMQRVAFLARSLR